VKTGTSSLYPAHAEVQFPNWGSLALSVASTGLVMTGSRACGPAAVAWRLAVMGVVAWRSDSSVAADWPTVVGGYLVAGCYRVDKAARTRGCSSHFRGNSRCPFRQSHKSTKDNSKNHNLLPIPR